MKKTSKKTKITAAVIAAVIVICVFSTGFTVYCRSVFRLQCQPLRDPKKEGSYLYMPMAAVNLARPDFAVERAKERKKAINDDWNKLKEELSNSPQYMVDMDYKNKLNKTVITYSGKVANPDTGKLEDFERVYEYDFILTYFVEFM